MPSVAATGTCPRRCRVAKRGLPSKARAALVHYVAADDFASTSGRVHHSFTDVNSIGYEDHGFAESFGGYQFVAAEVTSVRSASPVNPAGEVSVNPARKLGAQGRALGATDVAQCHQLFSQRRMVASSQVLAARIAMAHNLGGLTVLSAGTILEGPAANGS
jgi:acetyl-CoA C-acetyltransferase